MSELHEGYAKLPTPRELREIRNLAAKPHPSRIAQAAWDNGHVPTFLTALCELLMCSDPWPASEESERELKAKADTMARNLGFSDWVEAFHGLCESNAPGGPPAREQK